MAEKVGPTKLGKMVVVLFIIALVAVAAFYFRDLIAPGGEGPGDIDLDKFQNQVGNSYAAQRTG